MLNLLTHDFAARVIGAKVRLVVLCIYVDGPFALLMFFVRKA
jgi:hypothetical protein